MEFEFATEVIDRSTLEPWSVCPMQAWLLGEKPQPESFPMRSGTEVHDAISRAIRLYLDDPMMGTRDLASAIERYALESRPDVQPDVMRAIKPGLYGIAKYIAENNPANILRFDGGTDDKSGQLAVDLDDDIRLTCEVDLLWKTASPEVLDLDDWKSGWKPWSTQAVADSFQFQFYSFVILSNYPTVQAVMTRIWMPRMNDRTYKAEFCRRDMDRWQFRIQSALSEMQQAEHRQPPAWPLESKCKTCPVRLDCIEGPVSDKPEDLVDELVKLDAKRDELTERLSAAVEARGGDIVSPLGNAFGYGKPKKPRKPTASVYQRTPDASDHQGGTADDSTDEA